MLMMSNKVIKTKFHLEFFFSCLGHKWKQGMWSKEEIDILINNIDRYVKVLELQLLCSVESSACFDGPLRFRVGASTTRQRSSSRCPKRRGRTSTARWLWA